MAIIERATVVREVEITVSYIDYPEEPDTGHAADVEIVGVLLNGTVIPASMLPISLWDSIRDELRGKEKD